MASSFRRRVPKGKVTDGSGIEKSSYTSLLGLKGTKPWARGTTLTSVGLRDLDSILGGGQPLGTCILLAEDRWTRDFGSSLVRYWCAEAVSHQQHLVTPIFGNKSESTLLELDELLESLPRNLHFDKHDGEASARQEQHPSLLETLVEEDEAKQTADEGLTIAWQYRKDVQQERSGASQPTAASNQTSNSTNVFCHSFDLSGLLSDQRTNISSYVKQCNCCCDDKTSDAQSGFQLFRTLLSEVLKCTTSSSPPKVVRLLLYHPEIRTLHVALPLLLAQFRNLGLPVVVLVCIQPWRANCPVSQLLALEHVSDVVLHMEGFSARKHFPPPSEFRHLHGLLMLRKATTATASTAIEGGHFADLTKTKRAAANIYGVKRDRRKLHISLLHIPPEDHAEGGGSVGGGAVRSGAGKVSTNNSRAASGGCSSSALDF